MKDKVITFLFGLSILYFATQVSATVNNNLSEQRQYNNKKIQTVQKDSEINVINAGGIILVQKDIPEGTNMKIKPNIVLKETTEKKKELIDTIDSEKVDFRNSSIYIPGYIEESDSANIIWSENENNIYQELLDGVRASSLGKKPNQLGITFLEAHSGQNYKNTLSYSFFDNLSLYYDQLEYDTPIYIKTNSHLFEYRLFKKEVVDPGQQDIIEAPFHHLVLMTCYPRNTSQKRALLHAKLVKVTLIK